MNTVEMDGVYYNVDLLSSEGQSIFSVLAENNKRLKESQLTSTLYSASGITLMRELKTHLKEEAIVAGTATLIEE
tara:strand:- start:961 stop:1185 length:225 start_codon:yes stop_codon:yes gene_type:complete